MRKLSIAIAAFLCLACNYAFGVETIRISTDNVDLILQVAENNRLYQIYLGDRLKDDSDISHLYIHRETPVDDNGEMVERGGEAYAGSGGDDYFEPALAITHADGNLTTYLYYKGKVQKAVAGGTEAIIYLADDRYADEVALHYVAYDRENVIKTWSEIVHHEKHPITLWRYASGMFYFSSYRYYLTSYHGNWAREGQPQVRQLPYGKTVIDSKLGTRAALYAEPFFELGFDEVAKENEGKVMLGTIGWTGNFSCTFEIDNTGRLRVIPGINSYASDYVLKSGEIFKTSEFIFTFSNNGTSQATRNLHEWARHYQLKNGEDGRMVIYNNWETTRFNFTQSSLEKLMMQAAGLNVDLFLLDDGWFGNKYPRNDTQSALGDWQAMRTKLPDGIKALTKAAKCANLKFGIWIEPEMISPRSELFEKHKDWVILQPNREPVRSRHQFVLDLANPQVQDYVFGIVDKLMTDNPDIAYFKWDCNSHITNLYSPYEKDKQGNMFIDYVRGLYKVLGRVKAKYPKLHMMMCSGGGSRCDYEALKYFEEMWTSDDTDPYERLYIQWSLSKFIPVKALAAHVTNWNKQASLKFRTDVASMCKLGLDMDLTKVSDETQQFLTGAIRNWRRLSDAILDGNQYRLVSPYETNHAAVAYVSANKEKAVLFAYDLHPRFREREQLFPVKLQGLDANKRYSVRGINLAPGTTAQLPCEGRSYTGDYLMKVGLDVLSATDGTSHVLELTAQ